MLLIVCYSLSAGLTGLITINHVESACEFTNLLINKVMCSMQELLDRGLPPSILAPIRETVLHVDGVKVLTAAPFESTPAIAI